MSLKVNSLSDQDVIEVCNSYFSTTEYKRVKIVIVSYEVTAMGEVPTGFLSQQGLLIVKCMCGDNEQTLTFFIKFLPISSAKQLEYIENFGAFQKEIQVFQHIIPVLEKLSKAFAAHCYLAQPYDIIIFENLTEKGYTLSPFETGELDLEHMIVALDAVASLHASSIIYETQQKKLVSDIYPDCVQENSYPPHDVWSSRHQWVEKTQLTLCELVRRMPEYVDQLEYVTENLKNVINEIYELCKPSTKYRNVLNHADLWSNNIMFRYAVEEVSERKKPIEAKLVDFQLLRYAPVALDVLTLITITSNSEFRKKHLNKLLASYYASVEKELNNHNIDISVELPWDEFEESCREYRLAGLIESCLFSHLTVLPKSLVSKIVGTSDDFDNFLNGSSRAVVCLEGYEIDENYRYRMDNMLKELIDVFILKTRK